MRRDGQVSFDKKEFRSSFLSVLIFVITKLIYEPFFFFGLCVFDIIDKSILYNRVVAYLLVIMLVIIDIFLSVASVISLKDLVFYINNVSDLFE